MIIYSLSHIVPNTAWSQSVTNFVRTYNFQTYWRPIHEYIRTHESPNYDSNSYPNTYRIKFCRFHPRWARKVPPL
eukprot:UN26388